jgi:hypothetical protein
MWMLVYLWECYVSAMGWRTWVEEREFEEVQDAPSCCMHLLLDTAQHACACMQGAVPNAKPCCVQSKQLPQLILQHMLLQYAGITTPLEAADPAAASTAASAARDAGVWPSFCFMLLLLLLTPSQLHLTVSIPLLPPCCAAPAAAAAANGVAHATQSPAGNCCCLHGTSDGICTSTCMNHFPMLLEHVQPPAAPPGTQTVMHCTELNLTQLPCIGEHLLT